MRETISLNGIVLKSFPAGEYDRRLVILTKERGKITAFARGAKRQGNRLMAMSRPLVFGCFQMREGRDAYNLQSGEIRNYFTEIAEDMESACYASYFLELADYCSRENMDGTELLLLLYQSMRALLKPVLPNVLIQLIFELRVMAINGEYTQKPPYPVGESAAYAWAYILSSPIEKLYTFVLNEEAFLQLQECVKWNKRHFLDHNFHSLEILQSIQKTVGEI